MVRESLTVLVRSLNAHASSWDDSSVFQMLQHGEIERVTFCWAVLQNVTL